MTGVVGGGPGGTAGVRRVWQEARRSLRRARLRTIPRVTPERPPSGPTVVPGNAGHLYGSDDGDQVSTGFGSDRVGSPRGRPRRWGRGGEGDGRFGPEEW